MRIPVMLVDHGSAIATPTASQSANGAKDARSRRDGVDSAVIRQTLGTSRWAATSRKLRGQARFLCYSLLT